MITEKLINLNKTYRRVLLISLALIIAAWLYQWIFAPYGKQLLAAQQYNSTLESTIRKARLLNTTLGAKKAKLEKLANEFDVLRNELFSTDEEREFYATLPATARQVGCVVQSVIQSPDKKAGSQNQPDASGIAEKKAVVTVIGGYNNIVKLFEAIQNYKRNARISAVRLDVGTAGKLKCQMTLTLYCIERTETNLYE